MEIEAEEQDEIWNDEERVKVQVMECKPVPFVAEGRSKLESVLQSLSEAPSAQPAMPRLGGA